MSSDDEIQLYLQSLLNHQAECQVEHCPQCLVLHGILDSVRYRMFSGPVFPEVMIGTRAAIAAHAPSTERITSQSLLPKMRRVRQRAE